MKMNKWFDCAYEIMRLSKQLIIVGIVLWPSLSLSEGLERLFSTPSERLYLNQMRSTGIVDSVSSGSNTNRSIEQPVNKSVKFNGFVRRSSGRSDAWVNGQHVGSDQMLIQKLDSQNRMRVQVPDADYSVRMKPGQVMDPVTGHVSEGYEEIEQLQPLNITK